MVVGRVLEKGALVHEADPRAGDDGVDPAVGAEADGGFEEGELAGPGGHVQGEEVVVWVGGAGSELGDDFLP